MKREIKGLTIFLVVLLSLTFLNKVSTYNVITTDLGTLGGSSVANDINDQGCVTGYSTTLNGFTHGFIWDRTNGMVDIGLTENENSYAFGINNFGQVTGYFSSSGNQHAFVWDQINGITDIGTLGGQNSWPSSINDLGQVVGMSDSSTGGNHAFIWDYAMGIKDLGTLGGDQSWAWDINIHGNVIGMSMIPSNYNIHGFIWDNINGMTDLGTLGGSSSRAEGINNQNQVVGYSNMPTGGYHAFFWDRTNGMVDIGTLGGRNSWAYDINELGQVVGISTISNGDYHAFVWDKTNGMTDLHINDGIDSVYAINNKGQIVGSNNYQALMWDIGLLDLTPPVITIKGLDKISLIVGENYIEEGAIALDDYDGDISNNIIITGFVDTSIPGLYTIFYDVTDLSGNQAVKISRIVEILTSQQGTTNIIDTIDDMVVSDVINAGNGKALIQELYNVLKSIDKGNTMAAINQLNSAIDKVKAFIKGGQISQEDGQILINAFERIINSLI